MDDLSQNEPTVVPEEPTEFILALEEAVAARSLPRVKRLCRGLMRITFRRGTPYPAEASSKILNILRRKRHFRLLIRVAERFLQAGQQSPKVRRQYAQALLDTGQIEAAFRILYELKTECERAGPVADSEDWAEAMGLLGRGYKQIYINAMKAGGTADDFAESLQRSIDHYLDAHEQSNHGGFWHGVNVVSLMKRAGQDGIGPDALPKFNYVNEAKTILVQLEKKESKEFWDYSVMAECLLALRKPGDALEPLNAYRTSERADAFEFASTLRQFEEVVGLDEKHTDHQLILFLLRQAVMERVGGMIELGDPLRQVEIASDLADGNHEAILGADGWDSFNVFVRMIENAKLVAKIETEAGNAHGTGFLFPGAQLHADYAGEWLLFTNAHVISDDPAELNALDKRAKRPSAVRVSFEAQPGDKDYTLGELLFTSGRNQLDCSILRLEAGPTLPDHELRISKNLPPLDQDQRVYILGHPRGQALAISLHDSKLVNIDGPRLHYRSPTDGGSSGSPVFNEGWSLIGIHHLGGRNGTFSDGTRGTYKANEGIAIQEILRAARAHLATKPVREFFARDGRRVLTFLGFSGKGYQDPDAMLAEARRCLETEAPAKTLVNIGVTPDGIGAVYELAKSMGFTTTGIVSSLAQDYGVEPSPFVDHSFFIEDETWGGFMDDGETLSPTSKLIVDLSDAMVAIGGGAIAQDELAAAQARGTDVQFFRAEMNHDKAREKGITNVEGEAAALFG